MRPSCCQCVLIERALSISDPVPWNSKNVLRLSRVANIDRRCGHTNWAEWSHILATPKQTFLKFGDALTDILYPRHHVE